jgi:hypothetical protein
MHTLAEKHRLIQQARSASSAMFGRTLSSQKQAAGSFFDLQRMIENQSEQRFFYSNAESLETGSGVNANNSVAHDFIRFPAQPEAPTKIQGEPSEPAPVPSRQTASYEHTPFKTLATVERYPFRAKIRRAPSGFSRSDAPGGQEAGDDEYFSIFEQLGAISEGDTAGASRGPAANGGETSFGETSSAPIRVPDIEVPSLAAVGRNDAVNGAFTYSGSINRGGAQPSGFGVTRSFDSSLTGIVITPTPGTFNVAATFEHPIKYQVRSGKGPDGQVDIASETDSDITKTNYPTVVSDLTPDMGDLNGRPPRTAFWAKDLTWAHELVHANDDNANGPGAMATVTAWLNSHVAASVPQVRTLLGALPGRFATALLAALSTEAGERHAYGDGAPSYKARADAIKAKGDRGEYPAGHSTLGAVLGGVGGLLLGGAAGAGIGFLAGGPVGAVVGGIIGGIGGLIGGIFAGR